MKTKINNLIETLKTSGKVDDLSLYFRRLNNGEWVNINETAKFSPASLMKVPIMIAYFKLSESDPSILDKKLTYDKGDDANLPEYTKPSKSIQKGQSYTVNELIEYMVVYSDNNALNLLVQNADPNSLQEVYTDLGIKIPNPTLEGADCFTVKDYALFIRILFNATYLNKDLSEKALEIMSRSDFKGGIVAGVPSDVPVAHKFGERIFLDPTGILFKSYELHDCGIVYYSQSPYLLCIMTKGSKGKNYSDLEDSIKQISQLVYSEVKNNYQ
jgi:beta-lactamase class A